MFAENVDVTEYLVAKNSQLLWASEQWNLTGEIRDLARNRPVCLLDR